MYKGKKIYVVYRALYGEQFVKESIESILDYADKVFIMHTDRPFGNVRYTEYKDELIRIPKKIDNLVERVKEIKSDKIFCIKKHYNTNHNQFTIMYNDHISPKYGTCDILIMMEVDHVFRKDQIELALNEFIEITDENDIRCATTEQWEIWKDFKSCVPQWNDKKLAFNIPSEFTNLTYIKFLEQYNPRLRLCTMFWRLDQKDFLPVTSMHCNPIDHEPYRLKARTHNFGFAWSYKLQFWKHIISLAISRKVNDTPPNEEWLEDKWVSWDMEKNNKDLEQSYRYEWTIPKIIPYDQNELPESIKKNLDKHISLCYDYNVD